MDQVTGARDRARVRALTLTLTLALDPNPNPTPHPAPNQGNKMRAVAAPTPYSLLRTYSLLPTPHSVRPSLLPAG